MCTHRHTHTHLWGRSSGKCYQLQHTEQSHSTLPEPGCYVTTSSTPLTHALPPPQPTPTSTTPTPPGVTLAPSYTCTCMRLRAPSPLPPPTASLISESGNAPSPPPPPPHPHLFTSFWSCLVPLAAAVMSRRWCLQQPQICVKTDDFESVPHSLPSAAETDETFVCFRSAGFFRSGGPA